MYKAPLNIYVVWHPEFKDGLKYAEAIYSHYTRDITKPLSRGIGIPVYFRSAPHDSNEPIDINLSEAEANAIILLVDVKAINNWKEFAKKLLKQIDENSNKTNRLLPVALAPSFPNIGNKISENNYIRLDKVKGGYEVKKNALIAQLSHELCRILLNKPRIADINKRLKLSDEPVSLFLSHAKHDGEGIAKKIKAYADSNKPVDTFFDSIDIAPGHRFEEELDANIELSALLVIQTDSYSSRKWCRWEVLRAKRRGKPVVVINAIEEGEPRSFPYLGNVPTIRWKGAGKTVPKQVIEKIIDFTLDEVLRFTYTQKYLGNIKGLVSITGTHSPKILASPPELLTLLEKTVEESTKGNVVIYPDPPLTAEELDLLSETSQEYAYLTPTQLLAYQEIKAAK